jgi:hypothetical protein
VGDLPVPLYNIYGDGRDVLGVFRPSTSEWYVGGQSAGIGFGGRGDVAVAADFDGLGHDELAVYRPSSGEWYVGGHGSAVATFGSSSDIPLASPYAYRALPGTVGSSGASPVSPPDLGDNALTMAVGQGTATSPLPAAAPQRIRRKPPAPKVIASGLRLTQVRKNVQGSVITAPQGTLGRRNRGRFGPLG